MFEAARALASRSAPSMIASINKQEKDSQMHLHRTGAAAGASAGFGGRSANDPIEKCANLGDWQRVISMLVLNAGQRCNVDSWLMYGHSFIHHAEVRHHPICPYRYTSWLGRRVQTACCIGLHCTPRPWCRRARSEMH